MDGTLWIAFANDTIASVSVVRNWMSSKASFWCLPPLGRPITSGPRSDAPSSSGCPSSTGKGAVPYCRSGTSSSRKRVRHSPSMTMAILPVSNGFCGVNSSPAVAVNFVSLS